LLDAISFLRHNNDMSSDEREIFNYLQTWAGEYINAKEVSRRAGTKKRFHEDPDWARPILQAMVDNGLVECDLRGLFRVKPEGKRGHKQRWVSPDIEEIFKEKGVSMDIDDAGTPVDGES
jgi:hypothetical protein